MHACLPAQQPCPGCPSPNTPHPPLTHAPHPLAHQAYGRELDEAYEWCLKYRQSRKEAELHQAWDLYYHVFKRINKQLPSLTTLELQYVAPALVRAQVRCAPLAPWSAGGARRLLELHQRRAAEAALHTPHHVPPATLPPSTPTRRAWSWLCRGRTLRASRWSRLPRLRRSCTSSHPSSARAS